MKNKRVKPTWERYTLEAMAVKKFASLFLILMICMGGSAFAKNEETEIPAFEDILFENAKDSLWLIVNGEYELALKLLDFVEGAPGEQDFEAYIRDTFLTIEDGEIQYEVAVAYYDGELWTLAIPLYEPDDKEIETFLLFSEDGQRFVGCGYMPWGEVEELYAPLYDVIWNVEYCPEGAVICVDEGESA